MNVLNVCVCMTTSLCPSDIITQVVHLAASSGGAATSSLPPLVLSQLAAPLVKANPHVLTRTQHQAFMAAAVSGYDNVG